MTSFTTKCITPVLCCLYPGNLRCVKFDSMLSRLSPTKGVPGDPRGSHSRQIPHPASLVITQVKKALYHLLIDISLLPQHFISSRLPTFLTPISPSSLFCTSSLVVVHAREPASSWRENVRAVVILQRV